MTATVVSLILPLLFFFEWLFGGDDDDDGASGASVTTEEEEEVAYAPRLLTEDCGRIRGEMIRGKKIAVCSKPELHDSDLGNRAPHSGGFGQTDRSSYASCC